MSIYQYLEDHARKNVWCSPDKDLQSIIQPKKLTPYRGVFNQIRLQWATISLPTTGERYHVYNIGQLHPLLMGLFPSTTWESVADVCTRMKMIVDVYSAKGIHLPRAETYYRVMENRNLVFAVKEQLTIPFNQDKEDLFIRVYSNAYFGSVRYDTNLSQDAVFVSGKKMRNNIDILNMQKLVKQYGTLPGKVVSYVNGYKVSAIDLITVQPGDFAEFVYDSSIVTIKEFQVSDLQMFVSTLDQKNKYLLHYPGQTANNIDYEADIDVYIYLKDGNGRHKGVYYHKNSMTGDALRNVTHRDYSIPVGYLQDYVNNQPAWNNNPMPLTVALYIRKSGLVRPLVFENNRIHELYKLPDSQIVGAMLGIDSTVDNWQAATLEASAYPQLMRESLLGVTEALTEQAYGYNAISKLLGDTPKFTYLSSSLKIIDLPYGQLTRCSGYEYDVNGKLLGWSEQGSGNVYAARDFRANLIEIIIGQNSRLLDEVYGQRIQILDPTANYRMYTCPIVNGTPTNQWVDVTGSNKYVVVNHVLTWLIDPIAVFTMVRSDRIFLAYSLDLPEDSGVIRATLTSRQYRNGMVSDYVMQVPMGELDVWLNGHALIENIDYIVKFPEVLIINKKYLVDPGNQLQHIDIRFTGHCDKDLKRTPIPDYGFVSHGLLSHNSRYDIRDDKVLRIVVGGSVYERSQLKFSETDNGIQVDAANGLPYMVKDIVVPFRGNTEGNTYDMRAASMAIDTKVSNYMSRMLPEPLFTTPNPIQSMYELYSPFCSAIIHDLTTGDLSDVRLFDTYGDDLVRELCQPYEFLLAYDPTQDQNLPDLNYCVIHPHDRYTVINLQAFKYRFMERVIRIYTKNRTNLSHFVNISVT